MNPATSRLGKLAAALDAATPGAHWTLTRPRGWRAAELERAIEHARRHGLPDGQEAAPAAQHYSGGATSDCSFPDAA